MCLEHIIIYLLCQYNIIIYNKYKILVKQIFFASSFANDGIKRFFFAQTEYICHFH